MARRSRVTARCLRIQSDVESHTVDIDRKGASRGTIPAAGIGRRKPTCWRERTAARLELRTIRSLARDERAHVYRAGTLRTGETAPRENRSHSPRGRRHAVEVSSGFGRRRICGRIGAASWDQFDDGRLSGDSPFRCGERQSQISRAHWRINNPCRSDAYLTAVVTSAIVCDISASRMGLPT